MALGATSANDCTAADLFQYLETIPPGSNRRSHFKTLKKLWRWAFQRGDIEVDPMARMKPADNWGVNVEHLTPALYTQILRVIAGKESPAKGQEATNDYWIFHLLGGATKLTVKVRSIVETILLTGALRRYLRSDFDRAKSSGEGFPDQLRHLRNPGNLNEPSHTASENSGRFWSNKSANTAALAASS